MKSPGLLTISSVTTGKVDHPTGRFWRIRVLTPDKKVLVDVDVEMEPFALALSTVVEQPCQVRAEIGVVRLEKLPDPIPGPCTHACSHGLSAIQSGGLGKPSVCALCEAEF